MSNASIKKNFLNWFFKHEQGEGTTIGHVPWIFAGDESGAKTHESVERFACYSMVGIPYRFYQTFIKSLPTPNKDRFLVPQLAQVRSMLKACCGHGVVVYFDLQDPKVIKYADYWERKRKKSTLEKPGKVSDIIWVNSLAFSIIELVGKIVKAQLPIGELFIEYDGWKMPKLMAELMKGRVPGQANLRLQEIFLGLKTKFPKANPTISKLSAGKSRDPMIMAADVVAKATFQALSNKQIKEFQKENNPAILIRNLTDILGHKFK